MATDDTIIETAKDAANFCALRGDPAHAAAIRQVIDALTADLRERDEARDELAMLRDAYGAALSVAVTLFQPGGKHPSALRPGDHIIPGGLTRLDAERDRLLAEIARLRSSSPPRLTRP